MDDSEFAQVLEYLQVSEVELRDNYDAVFHLVTASYKNASLAQIKK